MYVSQTTVRFEESRNFLRNQWRSLITPRNTDFYLKTLKTYIAFF